MLDEMELPQLMAAPAARTIVDGREVLYFGGTGYLGLQAHPEVIRAGCAALERYGVHSATTRTNFGNPLVREVEQAAAELTGNEAAFYFASGYLGPSVLAIALADQFDAVFVDEQAHYSVHDAARRCGLPMATFAHRDPANLAAILLQLLSHGGRPLVMCDGVSPVSGAIAPLADYEQVLSDYRGSGLLVDDAHGFGVLGPSGFGTWTHGELRHAAVNADLGSTTSGSASGVRRFCCATLSKAIGGHGGIIVGTLAFIGHVKTTGRLYAGSTPPTSAAAGCSLAGLRLTFENNRLRERLLANTRQLRTGLQKLAAKLDDRSPIASDSPVPIVALAIGDQSRMRGLQAALLGRNIAIGFLCSYTNLGPHGALRISVFADHEPWMIEALLEALQQLL